MFSTISCILIITSCSFAIANVWNEDGEPTQREGLGVYYTNNMSNEMPIEGSQNDSDITNTTIQKLGTMSGSIGHLDLDKTKKTIAFGFVIAIVVAIISSLGHLLVFHIYICAKGMTTYEYLRPSVSLPSPTTSAYSRKSVPDNKSCLEADDESTVDGDPSGSISISKEINRGNSNETADSDTVWNTMTEIDLQNPNELGFGTLPNNGKGFNHTNSGNVEVRLPKTTTGNSRSLDWRKLLFWRRVNRVNITHT